MSQNPDSIPAMMQAIHDSLTTAGIEHAFGGALALAWCTRQARGTIDLDVNVFVTPDRTDDAVAGLPAEITITDPARTQLEHDGQTRL